MGGVKTGRKAEKSSTGKDCVAKKTEIWPGLHPHQKKQPANPDWA